jgi:hypothetical protein
MLCQGRAGGSFAVYGGTPPSHQGRDLSTGCPWSHLLARPTLWLGVDGGGSNARSRSAYATPASQMAGGRTMISRNAAHLHGPYVAAGWSKTATDGPPPLPVSKSSLSSNTCSKKQSVSCKCILPSLSYPRRCEVQGHRTRPLPTIFCMLPNRRAVAVILLADRPSRTGACFHLEQRWLPLTALSPNELFRHAASDERNRRTVSYIRRSSGETSSW